MGGESLSLGWRKSRPHARGTYRRGGAPRPHLRRSEEGGVEILLIARGRLHLVVWKMNANEGSTTVEPQVGAKTNVTPRIVRGALHQDFTLASGLFEINTETSNGSDIFLS